ncbi:MAG TPA: IS21 family transposase [Pseudomonadales bacterium]|nr:IS21 family transposase [Pseudomonadales bacterium]
MLTQEQSVEIRVLARQGQSIRQIAKTLGISRNTVRRHLKACSPAQYGPREARPSKLEPYKAYVQQRIRAAAPHWIPATVLFHEIREQGYTGGATLLRGYVASLKPARSDKDPVVRFETAPGQQMQADFVTFRRRHEPLSAFVATLGYSRMSFVRFVSDESFDSVKQCLLAAFDYFGGVPQEVLFDNMKTVVLTRDAYGPGEHRFHAGLLQLAADTGFSIRLCRPYRARTKGKVERFNRYLRESFFNPLQAHLATGRLLVDERTGNLAVMEWLNNVANVRIHATTLARPIDRWRHEQGHLQPLPVSPSLPSEARPSVVVPFESLQHPLALYEAIREACA